MAEASLLEKLVTVLRSRHVAVGDDSGNTSGRMTQGSAADLAQALLGTVRQHDEARGRKRDDPAPIAEFCARCGNHFRGEQVCDACRTGDDAPDPELAAMATIVAALDSIATGDSDEDGRAIRRIVRYLCDRCGTED